MGAQEVTRVEPGEVYREPSSGSWWFVDFPGEGICCWAGIGHGLGDRSSFGPDLARNLQHVPSAEVPQDISKLIVMLSLNIGDA